MTLPRILRRAAFLVFIASGLSQSAPYFGAPLGTFETVSNNVKGEAFAIDDQTIFVKGFSYDGQSEDAVFWAGSSEFPDMSGFIIPNDISQYMPIPSFFNQDIILHLRERKYVKSLRWLSVWNRDSSKNLGTLIFPYPIDPPQPMAIGPLVNTKRGVSTGDILIIDSQTFLVPDSNYDGSEKEAFWWLSKGTKPSEIGIRLLENGSATPLPEHKNQTVILTLPKDHFIPNYDTLSIWSKSGDFGFVDVPKNLNIPPSPLTQESQMDEFNCEMLNDNLGLEVRWLIKGEEVIIHLIGNIDPTEYMALGLSKDDAETRFDFTDAVIAGIDPNGKGYATDYFFESNEKCHNGRGMCPDSIHGSVDNLELLQAERRGNSTIVVFKRRLRADDKVYDQNIYTDGPQAVLWAVGQLLSDGFADTPFLQSRGNLLLDFGREPNWNCPPPMKRNPSSVYSKEKSHHIHCPSDRNFRAQIGSSPRSNVKKIWFLNGLPTPELTVQRGNMYTFIVEGGHHHPFYITSNKEGGLYKNILEANDEIEVTYAGIQQDHITGTIFSTAEGRLCDWSYSDKVPELLITTTNQDTKPALVLKCEPGQPGRLSWTPSAETPDIVYYQSFMERNLGGKIRVVDFCEETNPQRYLEIAAKNGKPKTSPEKDELERESEKNEFSFSNTKNEGSLNVEEMAEKHKRKENLSENIPTEFIHENFPTKNDKYTISNNVINSFRISSDNPIKTINAGDKPLSDSTISPSPQESKRSEELFPHDESERSDLYVPHQTELRKTVSHNKVALNSHRAADDMSLKHPTHSSSEMSSISVLSKLPPQEFKPHFEGGFIPLVMNPMKEKELAQTKEFTYPPQYQNRPHRPFLYNESVPFHGTFKPGVPDFSGFNISNYSQEDASIIIAHNQNNLPILSASKHQSVHKPFPHIGAIPLHLLQRHSEPPRRPQRPQDFGHRFRQQNPSFVGTRKNVFTPPSMNNKANFPIPNIREEDLTGVSSQRVYVSLQAAGDKKTTVPVIPNMGHSSTHNRKHQNSQQNKMIYPLPIQRRPDIYEEKEVNMHRPNSPQRKFNTPRTPSNINKNNPQKLNMPILPSGGLQGQVNIRSQVSNIKLPIKNSLPGNREHIMVPSGSFRQPYPVMQGSHGERIPQGPVMLKGIALRPNPPTGEKLKINEGFLNHPQNPGNRLPFPFHMINPKGQFQGNSQETVESQESDSSSSKEHRPLPLLVNAELIEVPNKNLPQHSMNNRPTIHSSLIMQKHSLNESLNAFAINSNIRNPHAVSSMINTHSNKKNLPFEGISNSSVFLNQFEKSSNASEIEKGFPAQINSRPIISNVYDTFVQNSGSDRNKISSVKEVPNIKLDEFIKLDSRPANLDHQVFEKSILEALSSEEFSSSNPIQMELPIFSDYHSVADESDRSDSVIIAADYANFDVPFGARLKFPQNGTKIPVSEIPKNPFGVVRKPPTNRNRNTNAENKRVETQTTTVSSSSTTITSTTSTTSTTTEATLLDIENASNIAVGNKQNTSFEKDDSVKYFYYTPPFSSLPIYPHISNNSTNFNKDSGSSEEVKHIPIIADTLEDIIETKYLGRKNILSPNSNFSFPAIVMPPKVSENINLPQTSENPPTHDNRTDYSILNHVLTLIGGPPEEKEQQATS